MLQSNFFIEPIDRHRTAFDMVFAVMIVSTVMIGLGVLLSASYFRAQQLYGDPLRFVARQSLWVLLGIGGLIAALLVPIDQLRTRLPWLVLLTLVLLGLTFVPGFSARYLGARRWIFIRNISFQPSELAKLTIVLYLSHIFARRNGSFARPFGGLLPATILSGAIAFIVLAQNDFSTAAFLLMIAMLMYFAGGVPVRYFVRMIIGMIPLVLIGIFSKEHRVERIISFLNPNRDPAGSGFQVLSARRALAAGGFWGVGIGQGARKLGALPEAHSDFVFAVLAEEIGLVGVILIVLLFAAIAGRGLYLASRISDPFRSLVVFGLTCSIALQAFVNIAVVVGLAPATGIPLPFFSAGGSSLFLTMISCGLLLNAARDGGEAHG